VEDSTTAAIAATSRAGRTPAHDWKRLLADAIRDPEELLRVLGLPENLLAASRRGASSFPLLVPRGFAARMRRGDPSDPLLRQVLPLAAESEEAPGFVADPLAETRALRAPGLLQKYAGRALLLVSGRCAVHCRYCFRRHYPYDDLPRGAEAWEPALRAIAADSSLHEVILSGGDPLVLTDESLSRLSTRLDGIPHLRRLRVHSRLPVVLPERVNGELLAWLCGGRLRSIVVVHSNHPAELDAACAAALRRLVEAGVPTLNQAVLLRGVNDDEATLAELCERLADLGVLAYYLHQLDPVAGAAHFEVPVERGLEILAALRARLPGYAVPRYVQELPGAPHKVELWPESAPAG
jgi:EF-P beta-lysylation protein EpmB